MTREEIITRLEGCLDEMFVDFQGENDIDNGDTPFDLAFEMNKAEDVLADAIEKCMWWQKLNTRRTQA